MNITDRATAQQILNAFTATGAKAPKALTEAWQRTTRLSEGVRGLSTPPEAIYAAVAAAIERGDDPAADAEVQRILTSTQIQNAGVMAGVDDLAFGAFREACTAHTDAIVNAWRKPFDAAAATLADAHHRLGDVALDDTTAIIAKGGDAADVWAQAQAATKTIEAVRHGWLGLVGITHAVPDDRNHAVLRIAAVDYETWTARQLHGQRLSAWDAVLAGLTLALPTMTEYRERLAVITRGEAAEARQIADAGHRYATGRAPLAVS